MSNDKPADTSIFTVLSLADLEAEQAAWENPTMPASDPTHPQMFVLSPEERSLTLWWGGYDYTVPLAGLSEPEGLLFLLHHVLGKDWEQTTQERVVALIDRVAGHFGWAMYEPRRKLELSVRTTTDAAERAKLTPKLRYDVLTRDNFRCRACGASPETGAHLHIDHIKPISDGGLTIFDNLQALCSPCNFGKGARK